MKAVCDGQGSLSIYCLHLYTVCETGSSEDHLATFFTWLLCRCLYVCMCVWCWYWSSKIPKIWGIGTANWIVCKWPQREWNDNPTWQWYIFRWIAYWPIRNFQDFPFYHFHVGKDIQNLPLFRQEISCMNSWVGITWEFSTASVIPASGSYCVGFDVCFMDNDKIS